MVTSKTELKSCYWVVNFDPSRKLINFHDYWVVQHVTCSESRVKRAIDNKYDT